MGFFYSYIQQISVKNSSYAKKIYLNLWTCLYTCPLTLWASFTPIYYKYWLTIVHMLKKNIFKTSGNSNPNNPPPVWTFNLITETESYIKSYYKQRLSSIQSLRHVGLCNPMDCITSGFPVHHQLPVFTQTHVLGVGDAIQPSHPLYSPPLPTFNLSQHQGLFQKVSSSR